MEFIMEYNGTKIYKEFGMYTISTGGGHIEDLNFLKHLIDLKKKRDEQKSNNIL